MSISSSPALITDDPLGASAEPTGAIGIDFDNTIVCYDTLFHAEAVSLGLIPADTPKVKDAVRDRIRADHGDLAWQRLQGLVYGPRMQEAPIFAGVVNFLKRCRQQGETVYVVSHKTEYAPHDGTRTNLRAAALTWMERHGFFEAPAWRIARAQIFFEASRTEKIERILRLGCRLFIDDLPEVLLDAALGERIRRILFCPAGHHPVSKIASVASSWPDIMEQIFGDARRG